MMSNGAASTAGEKTRYRKDLFTEKTRYRKDLFTSIPQQPAEEKPGQLHRQLLEKFFQDGYIVLPDFFHKTKLDACQEEITKSVDNLANDLYNGGKIKNLYKDHGFLTRMIHLEEEFPGASILLPKKLCTLPKSFQELWTDEKLLNIAEQIIGPDIMGHPVWNLRPKIPNNEATLVPWHQDSGYFDENAMDVFQLTAWIPFVDANEANGTLKVAERAHQHGELAEHVCCLSGTWYVEFMENEMEKTLKVDMKQDLKTLEVPYGGLVLFSNILPHCSVPNVSNITRWSCDLRWQSPHKKLGFYGLKPGILFRTKENPNMKPDWDSFNAYDRDKIQLENMGLKDAITDRFDTTNSGPWMNRWEIVNTNRHTAAHRHLPTTN